ncbi:fumarylacetoacetate hydrolase family protein [Parvibaculum sp.]|uniref:fumarylacetoacetate hydrolase family protein n=1 Tax=Parvibaculum sp. TaxID=2024848 RepID=UPI003299151C
MKLMRHGRPGSEKPGLIDASGGMRDLSGVVPDIGGEVLLPESLAKLAALDSASLPAIPEGTRYGPCVASVGKFICVGLNYADHAAESGMEVPAEPVLFFKATSAICGPDDDIVIPRGSIKTDWEVELGVVVGREARYIAKDEALDYVAGYCVINDLSEREFQLERGGQWVKGKSCDTFGPIGPWLVTRDEVPNPQDLGIWLEVDGVRHQDGNTRTMIFGIAEIVSYISQFMSLQPGDIISTGTPPGVGLGMKPKPVYLHAGQTIRLGIDGLGEQNQRTVSESGEAREPGKRNAI